MIHSCSRLLCATPHYEDTDCSCDNCELCHKSHRENGGWRSWNVYPECWRCEEELFEEIKSFMGGHDSSGCNASGPERGSEAAIAAKQKPAAPF